MNVSVYSRPAGKARQGHVPRYEKPAIGVVAKAAPIPAVSRHYECHVTPVPVVKRMIEYVTDVITPNTWYEPEAGTGNILREILKLPGEVYFNELEASLFQYVVKHIDEDVLPRVRSFNGCSLERNAEFLKAGITFDAIVANHPFRPIKKHFQSVLKLLSPGGVYVGVVPIDFKSYEYRLEELEELPKGTFTLTPVRTKLIRVTN